MNGQESFEKGYVARLAIPTDLIGSSSRQVLEHSARTAVTAVASMLAARVLRLPQTYWAPITTLVITQSSLGATLAVSWQRFIGTAVGAALGALVASYFVTYTLVFATSVFGDVSSERLCQDKTGRVTVPTEACHGFLNQTLCLAKILSGLKSTACTLSSAARYLL
jgi:Fusaric acid resistance protein-like